MPRRGPHPSLRVRCACRAITCTPTCKFVTSTHAVRHRRGPPRSTSGRGGEPRSPAHRRSRRARRSRPTPRSRRSPPPRASPAAPSTGTSRTATSSSSPSSTRGADATQRRRGRVDHPDAPVAIALLGARLWHAVEHVRAPRAACAARARTSTRVAARSRPCAPQLARARRTRRRRRHAARRHPPAACSPGSSRRPRIAVLVEAAAQRARRRRGPPPRDARRARHGRPLLARGRRAHRRDTRTLPTHPAPPGTLRIELRGVPQGRAAARRCPRPPSASSPAGRRSRAPRPSSAPRCSGCSPSGRMRPDTGARRHRRRERMPPPSAAASPSSTPPTSPTPPPTSRSRGVAAEELMFAGIPSNPVSVVALARRPRARASSRACRSRTSRPRVRLRLLTELAILRDGVEGLVLVVARPPRRRPHSSGGRSPAASPTAASRCS